MSTIFSENLKELRKINNYSQKQAAELIGIGRARLGSYEEQRCEPPIDVLISICKCYGITDLYGLFTKKISDSMFTTPIENNKAMIALKMLKKILDTI